MFSELELTGRVSDATSNAIADIESSSDLDDDRYLEDGVSPDLGQIKLAIHRVEVRSTDNVAKGTTYSEPQKVHERSKKAMGHRCTLGPEVSYKNRSFVHTRRLEKIATFTFKYRPLAQLQANGIVPQEKKRKRASEAVEIVDLTEIPENKRDKDRRKRVKEEPKALSVKDESLPVRIKEEEPVGRRPRCLQREVIDLT
ncbi:hypothetical protein H0H92_014295 [Tricholoma furcatifolium]|nr:hypothetical protein H0H92_014295 [Tricholoma furcatifolium]